ncbi:hypothetical protein [Metabacillus sp. Hm71]|uniref:hypothetical protein n=1 Tax=Metabacillus sp. Hm71 TaxID=3450743 RepID=UPI003F43B9AF
MFKVGEQVQLVHTKEPGVVLMIDHQHEQVEILYEDNSCEVRNFKMIEKVKHCQN